LISFQADGGRLNTLLLFAAHGLPTNREFCVPQLISYRREAVRQIGSAAPAFLSSSAVIPASAYHLGCRFAP